MSPVLVRDAEQWLCELRLLCDNRQLSELSALAHKIRGTADVLGRGMLSNLAKKLELSAKADETDQAVMLADQLISALRQLIRDIQPGA